MRKTMKTSRYALMLMMLLSLFLVACGDDDDGDDDDGGDSGVSLTQDAGFVSADGGITISLRLPDGWQSQYSPEQEQFAFASNAETLNQINNSDITTLEGVELSGEGGTLSVLPAEFASFLVEGDTINANTIFEAFRTSLTASNEVEGATPVEVGNPSNFAVNGFSSGVKGSISSAGQSGAIYILHSDTVVVIVTSLTNSNLNATDAIVRSIVALAVTPVDIEDIPVVTEEVPPVDVEDAPVETEVVPVETEVVPAE